MSEIKQAATKVRWVVFSLACAASWLLYLHRYAWGVIKKDVQDEFDLSKTDLGWLDACFSITYALGQIPGGWLGDVLGPTLVLPVMIAAWSICLGVLGLGVGFASLAGVRLGFGATQAGAYPNLGKISKVWFPAQIRTTMQGLVASFSGRLGGACGQFLIPAVFMSAWGLGWRSTLWILTALGLVTAVVVRLLLSDRPEEHPWTNDAECELLSEDNPPADEAGRVRFTGSRLAWISFGGLLIHIFTSAFADQIYVNWVPLFLEEDRGMDKAQMGFFAMLPLIGGAIGGMFGGVLNDVLRKSLGLKWARRLVGLIGKTVAGTLVLISLTIPDGRWMMVVIAVAKFFTDWSQPTVWGAVTDIAGRHTARVFGVVNMMGSMAGFVAGPTLGAIIESAGGNNWLGLFGTIAGVYFVSGAIWLVINTTLPLLIESDEASEDDAGTS